VAQRRRLILTIALAGTVVLIFLASGIVFCSAALHVPRKPVPNSPTLAAVGHQATTINTVSLTARDGAKLDGWFIDAKRPPKSCVMVLHGIADSRVGSAGFAPMFLDAGYSVLIPDSRAHGTSGGDIVTYGLLEKYDVIDWIAWLRGAGCTSIYGLGESLGAASLIQACSLAPVFRAAVAESSYSDLRSIAEYRVSEFSRLASRFLVSSGMIVARLRYGLDLEQASPRDAISRAQTPILLIHGLEDKQTPASHSIAIAAANPSARLWLVPGAGHTAAAAAAPAEFRRRVLDWFATH
jgi:uncharacterized protein